MAVSNPCDPCGGYPAPGGDEPEVLKPWTCEWAQAGLADAIAAEQAWTKAYWQSYQLGGRNLRYKDLGPIQANVQEWTRRVGLLCPGELPLPPSELVGHDLAVRGVMRDDV